MFSASGMRVLEQPEASEHRWVGLDPAVLAQFSPSTVVAIVK
ncbi:hypothetical protein [Brevibacterium yomogidense]|nr:hypothetical protein [Brevibacterium yomogidense]